MKRYFHEFNKITGMITVSPVINAQMGPLQKKMKK